MLLLIGCGEPNYYYYIFGAKYHFIPEILLFPNNFKQSYSKVNKMLLTVVEKQYIWLKHHFII